MLQKNKMSTVNLKEVEKFSALAAEWWDESGKFKPLHKFNPVRITYIRDKAIKHFGLTEKTATPLKGLKILDIGCGGGLLSVPMCRLGASVTAIDASERNILTANSHAAQEGLNINFQHSTVEELAKTSQKFDVILNMEVIEHVDNVPLFLESSCALLKDGGLMFIATLNRTIKSFLFAKIGAEYVLSWLPKRTHDWNKFLSPGEIGVLVENNGLKLKDITGVKYNPLKDAWALSADISINYLLTATK